MSLQVEPRGHATTSHKRAPDFFIVGHHKSGTSALYEMLRRHPQIYMPDLKEPRFLASDMRSRFRPQRVPPHPQTLEEYLALFDAAGPAQRAGEASATYLLSHTAAERIAEVQPRARIIAILREPASFLRSLHLQYVRIHFETEPDLRKAMSLEAPRREGRHVPRRTHLPQLLQYSENVHYVDQLSRYRRYFPSEQMLVLIYDDFRNDNAATLRAVLRFLEVDDQHHLEQIEANVTAATARSPQLDVLLESVSVGRGTAAGAVRVAAKALTTRRLRHRALAAVRQRMVLAEPPPPDEAFMIELRRRFTPEVRALSEWLGRDLLSLWGYDDLG
jgi:hypothetical protein